MNTGFVFPREICPFVSDVVAVVAAKAVVHKKARTTRAGLTLCAAAQGWAEGL